MKNMLDKTNGTFNLKHSNNGSIKASLKQMFLRRMSDMRSEGKSWREHRGGRFVSIQKKTRKKSPEKTRIEQHLESKEFDIGDKTEENREKLNRNTFNLAPRVGKSRMNSIAHTAEKLIMNINETSFETKDITQHFIGESSHPTEGSHNKI